MKYVAFDQYGGVYRLHTEHPRKELLEHIGVKSCNKMYAERNGGDFFTGYVIARLWIRVYGLEGRKFERRA